MLSMKRKLGAVVCAVIVAATATERIGRTSPAPRLRPPATPTAASSFGTAIGPDRDNSGPGTAADAAGGIDVVASAPALGPRNLPPSVTLGSPNGVGQLTVHADSPTGATIIIDAFATDPENDPLTYTWSGPFVGSPVSGPSTLTARFPLGLQQTLTVSVDDGQGNVVQASVLFDVIGTPFVGASTTPVDSTYNAGLLGYAPLTITAAGIGHGQNLAFLKTSLDKMPGIPSPLQAGSPPMYFEVSTNAQLVLPIEVCIDTSGMSLPEPAHIRLYHYRGSGGLFSWQDITGPGQPQAGRLCGQADSLGIFAIFYPPVAATAVTTIAGGDVRAGSIDGAGGDPADDFVAGPATASPLDYLFGLAQDRQRKRLYLTEGSGHIVQLDLQTGLISRVAGNGVPLVGLLDGPGGDLRDDLVEGGDAFGTYVGSPAEIVVGPGGDLLFFDRNTCLVRRLDLAQNKLFAVAGNGTCGSTGDGGPATQASVAVGNSAMVFDAAGHLFLGDQQGARIRRVDAATGVITTIAGDGTYGIPVDGAPALSTLSGPQALAFDRTGHLVVAAGMRLLRITPGSDGLVDGLGGETIQMITGCNTACTAPFGGDGLPASDPRIYLPNIAHLIVAQDGALLFSDTNRIRRITPGADGVVTGATDEIVSTIGGYFDFTPNRISNFDGDSFATQSLFSFVTLVAEDDQGRVIVADTNNHRVRRFGFVGGSFNPAAADLSLSGSAAPDPVDAGATLQFTLTVANAGPATATSVVVTHTLAAGSTFDSATGPAGTTCSGPAPGSGGTVTCAIGTLVPAASTNLTIVVRPQSAGTLTSVFTVSGSQPDPQASNDTLTLSTTVNPGVALVAIHERITVSDGPGVLASALVGLVERITVSDTPGILPAARVGLVEVITVADTPGAAAGGTTTGPTTTAMTIAPSPSVVGQSVVLTATVNGTNPTGTVTFFNGSTPLGTAAVSGGTATLPTASLNGGTYVLTATYGGDAGNAPSTSPGITHVVGRVQSQTIVSPLPSPSLVGQVITIRAVVQGSSPTGTVTFMDGFQVIGIAPVVNGVATWTTSGLVKGSHQLWGLYSGDTNNTFSAAPQVKHRVR